MTRFAIVEDDPQFREELGEFLRRYAEEMRLKYSLAAFSDGEEITKNYRSEFDIILMDVQMKRMDGMTAAKAIRRLDDAVIIIFITNMSQFAIEGYAVDALDYLLKPLTYYAFSQCLNRAMGRLSKREKRFLFVPQTGGGRKIASSDILFVEVHGHELVYHTIHGDYPVSGTMKEVEESLDGLPFFRCNKCDLVNLAHVEGLRNGDALVGTHLVQVSRAKKKPFLEALNRYLNEVPV